MSAADDEAILAALRAVANLKTFDGYVTDSDESEKTISAPLPYVVCRTRGDGIIGDPLSHARSLAGIARSLTFEVVSVGQTAEQARMVRDRQRAALDGVWISMPVGSRICLRDLDDEFAIGRDDVWTRPGGLPLFNSVDRYRVGA